MTLKNGSKIPILHANKSHFYFNIPKLQSRISHDKEAIQKYILVLVFTWTSWLEELVALRFLLNSETLDWRSDSFWMLRSSWKSNVTSVIVYFWSFLPGKKLLLYGKWKGQRSGLEPPMLRPFYAHHSFGSKQKKGKLTRHCSICKWEKGLWECSAY